MRRHNGIINNYKLKFQKSLGLHLNHLSQVRVRCPSGVHVVHVWLTCSARTMLIWPTRGARVWLACGVRLACLRCASNSPMVRVWLAHGLLT